MPTFDDVDLDNAIGGAGFVHENTPDTDYDNSSELKRGISPQPPNLTDGLVIWLPLHDDVGQDLSGYGNHGTLNGPTTGVAGRGGLEAMSFNSSNNDWIDCGNVLNISEPISFGAWVRPDTLSQDGCFISNGDPYFLWFNGTNSIVRFEMNDGSNYFGNPNFSYSNISANEWMHIFATYDGSTARIYLNGAEMDSVNTTNSIDTTQSEPFAIGQWGTDGRFFGGDVFDARVYNRHLSSAEVQTICDWGSLDLAQTRTDGVARYPLDGDATDAWGSNDLTAHGNPTFTTDSIRGQAANYDGDDYHSGGPSIASTSFTISAWVKADALSSNATYIGDNTDNNNHTGAYLELNASNGEIWFNIGDGSVWQSATEEFPGTGSWIHTVGVYDGTDHHLYVNGVRRSTYTNTTYLDSSNTLHLGREAHGNWSNYLDGKVDDARTYGFGLSPHEVHDLYQWGTFGRDLRPIVARAGWDKTNLETFDDQSLSGYTGDTAQVSFDTTNYVQGGVGLTAQGFTSSDAPIIITSDPSSNELPYYPESGDTFEVWLRATGSGSGACGSYFMFGCQDTSNPHRDTYFVRIWGNAACGVGRFHDGSITGSSTFGASTDPEEWHRVIVDWRTNGDIYAHFVDINGNHLDTLEYNDTTYSSGAVGWYAETGSSFNQTAHWDWLRRLQR